MMVELYDKLDRYKGLTIKLIDCMQKDSLDNLEELINERQDIIEAINNLKYNQEEFISYCENIELLSYENSLSKAFIERHSEIKNELKKISNSRTVKRNYEHNSYVDSIYLNRKY